MKVTVQKMLMILLIFLSLSPAIKALELYSVIRRECSSGTGLIIHVDDTFIYMLSLGGELVKTPKQGIQHILVYNTLENPFSKLDLSGPLSRYAREVKVKAKGDAIFIGWPIRFLEDLIVFFDLQGKTHLVDIELIQKFDIPEIMMQGLVSLPHNTSYTFGFGNNLPQCSEKTGIEGEMIQPTRMISDQIAISKFIHVYQKGFTHLDRFQKRTSFYARPYVYDKKTTVGIIVDREDFKEELPQMLPLNFQWPTGSNYGPQGILKLGQTANLLLPNVEPVFGVMFSGKYHFLSVSFAGNPMAFSFGSDYIIENRLYFKDFFSKRDPDEIFVFPQYNQVAMTGFEWGPYSVSGGFYYPIIGMQANGLFREVLSDKSMPIAGFQYTTPGKQYQILASDIRISSESPSDRTIKLILAGEMAQGTALTTTSRNLIHRLDSMSLHSRFLRFNFDYDWYPDVRLGLSEVYFRGDYEEVFSGSDYKLSYDQFITSFRARQEFADYVSLKFYLNYFIRQYHSQAENHEEEPGENKFSFAVVVEFIL